MTVTVGFSAPVTSVAYPGAIETPGSNIITFPAETLESNPTEFSLVLNTTGVPSGASVVSSVAYSDSQGNSPDLSSLMVVSFTPECNEDAGGTRAGDDADAAGTTTAEEDRAIVVSVSRRLQEEGEEEFDCSPCDNLSDAEVEELAKYDNGGKRVVCDPTCLDGVSDPTHCNCEPQPNRRKICDMITVEVVQG